MGADSTDSSTPTMLSPSFAVVALFLALAKATPVTELQSEKRQSSDNVVYVTDQNNYW